MATAETVKQEISKTATHPLRKLLQDAVSDLDKLRAAKFNRIAYSFVRANPEIIKCEPMSLLGAFMICAQLDLEPVAGMAYILPFNNSRKKPDGTWHSVREAQFILGYKGLANLFYRHEKAVELSWGTVNEKDEFEQVLGTEAYLRHKPAFGDRGAVLGYYCVARLSNGGKPFLYMSKEECLAHGKEHSKTFDKKKSVFYDNSPWNTDFDSMARKTVLIQLGKILPLSVDTQRAIQADESARDWQPGITSALELPVTTNWEEPKQIETPAFGSVKANNSMQGDAQE